MKYILFTLIAVFLFAACSNRKSGNELNSNTDELVLGITDEEGNFIPLVRNQGLPPEPVLVIEVDSIGTAHVFQGVAAGSCRNVAYRSDGAINKTMIIYVYPTTGKSEVINVKQ